MLGAGQYQADAIKLLSPQTIQTNKKTQNAAKENKIKSKVLKSATNK